MEEGGRHQALHLSGSRAARASVTWSGRVARKGQEPPQGAPQPPHPLSPHPRPSWPPLAVPQRTTGMLRCGATAVAQLLGRGKRPAPLAEGWGGMPAPAQEGQSWQPGTAAGPSVLFLEGLLGDECPEGVIPEAGADAEACGQGRERSVRGTAITGIPPGTGRSSLNINQVGATMAETGRAGSSRHKGHVAGMGHRPAGCKGDAG